MVDEVLGRDGAIAAVFVCGVQIESRGREFTVSALNERGKVLLSAIGDGLEGLEGVGLDRKDDKIHGTVRGHTHTQSCGSRYTISH